MNYEQSKERCKNIICGLCGRKVRPIHNDYEKRYNCLKCGKKRELQNHITFMKRLAEQRLI